MLSSTNCSVGTKLVFAISFTLNFILPLLADVEVDGLFFVDVGLSNLGFGLVVVVSVLVEDFVGDFIGEVVGVFTGDFIGSVVGVFVGDLVGEVVGVFVGDVIGEMVGDFAGDFVEDFLGFVFIEGLGSLVRDGGGVWVSDTDGDLGGEGVGEMEGVFVGEGGVVGSSSSTWVRLMSGESFITFGSFKVVPEGFRMSKRTFFGFLLDEVVACVASLNASEISCHTYFIAASLSSPDVGRSDLFLLFSLICVGCASDQIWKAHCRTFFFILGWSKFNSSNPLRRAFMSSSIKSLVV